MSGDITVISGPTAVGKGTVTQALKSRHPELWVSVSATTRAARPSEGDGQHYHFVSNAEFDELIAEDGLLEWATVHGRDRFGTPAAPVRAAVERGKRVILEIDLQGARQVRERLPEARLVFIAPPSWNELVHRLVGRGTENAEQRERRLLTARTELAAADEFDPTVVNHDLGSAGEDFVSLLSL